MIVLDVLVGFVLVGQVALVWAVWTRRPVQQVYVPEDAVAILKRILEEIEESQVRGKL